MIFERILLIAIFIMVSMLSYDFFFGKHKSSMLNNSIINSYNNIPQEVSIQKTGAKKIGEMCAGDEDCLNGKCINSLCGNNDEEYNYNLEL
jgi:hypothetical protein